MSRLFSGFLIGMLVFISSAFAAVTMPTADYTSIEAAAGVGFAVILTVGLLRKAKGFLR